MKGGIRGLAIMMRNIVWYLSNAFLNEEGKVSFGLEASEDGTFQGSATHECVMADLIALHIG